ncbi:MAG: PKD domain-containing protein, partial [Bacteroidota bacterium]
MHSDTVIVLPQPIAGFGTDLDEFCSPWTVNINNISTGNPDEFDWDFGDGTFSDAEEPLTHTYFTDSLPTDYTITLITTNECGIDTFDYTITVLPNTVTAFFNTNVIEGCEPLEVEFTDFSEGGSVIAYDFGDDNFTNNPNPTHVFEAGNWLVQQTVNNGCSFDTTSIMIEVFPSPDPAFSTDLPNVCEGSPIQFINETLDVNNVNWDFGDMNTSNITNPLHVYESGGTFDVSIEVTSNFNECTATLTQPVTVFANPDPDFSIPDQVGCNPFTVTFNNTTTGGSFYQWDFGDNESSGQENPTHTFINNTGEAVNFTVELIAQNLELCADTLYSTIVVSPSPVAEFIPSITETCDLPTTVNFQNTSLFANSYEWDLGIFGDANINEPEITLEAVGSYPIELTASNSFGCENSIEQTLTVHPTPEVEFNLDNESGCIN